jgi:cyanophycin synthetase
VWVERRRLDIPERSGALGIRAVLRHPCVDVAVLEVDRRDILREGLEFDLCSVAVVTNHQNEAQVIGSQGIESAGDLIRAMQVVVEAVAPKGVVVLPSTDARTASYAASCPGSVLYYAIDEHHEAIISHRDRAGRAVFVRDSHIIFAKGHEESDLLSLDRVSRVGAGEFVLQVPEVLAAVAAAWALGVPDEVTRNLIESVHDDVG